MLTDGTTDDRARAPHSRPDAKVETAVVGGRVRQHRSGLSHVQKATSESTKDCFEEKVPLRPISRSCVVPGTGEGESQSSNHTAPFDSNLIDQRPAEESDHTSSGVVKRVGHIPEVR